MVSERMLYILQLFVVPVKIDKDHHGSIERMLRRGVWLKEPNGRWRSLMIHELHIGSLYGVTVHQDDTTTAKLV